MLLLQFILQSATGDPKSCTDLPLAKPTVKHLDRLLQLLISTRRVFTSSRFGFVSTRHLVASAVERTNETGT